MAVQRDVTPADKVFLGEDKRLIFAIYERDLVTPKDASAWSMVWVVKKSDSSSSVVLSKATGGNGITVTGVYNADPSVSTQRVEVALMDTDTDDASGIRARTYRHALKRMDDGSETVLTFGDFTFLQATTW